MPNFPNLKYLANSDCFWFAGDEKAPFTAAGIYSIQGNVCEGCCKESDCEVLKQYQQQLKRDAFVQHLKTEQKETVRNEAKRRNISIAKVRRERRERRERQ